MDERTDVSDNATDAAEDEAAGTFVETAFTPEQAEAAVVVDIQLRHDKKTCGFLDDPDKSRDRQ